MSERRSPTQVGSAPYVQERLPRVEGTSLARSSAPLQRDALPSGTVLNGYRLLAALGRGGFGITYRASDLLDQSFAIKEFFPRQFAVRVGTEVLAASDSDQELFVDCRRRFLTEARLLANLGRNGGTPGIVRVATFFEGNNTAYSVMELLDGETLDDVLKTTGRALTAERVVSLLHGILTPLARVHAAGFLHRDIKPANILIRPNGQPVLIDFGSARDMGLNTNTTYTQVYSGHYAPIEQMMHGTEQGPFSDIYAVGGVAYKAIGGTLVDARTRQQAALVRAPDPLVRAVEVGRDRYPPSLLNAIDQALAVAASDRPQRVEEMLHLLDPPADDMTTRRRTWVESRPPVASGAKLPKDRNAATLNRLRSLLNGVGSHLFRVSRLPNVLERRSFPKSSSGPGNGWSGVRRLSGAWSRETILIALTCAAVSIFAAMYFWIIAPGRVPPPPVSASLPSTTPLAMTPPRPAVTTPPSAPPAASPPAASPPAPAAALPPSAPAVEAAPSAPAVAMAPSAPAVAPLPPATAEETWSPQDRWNVRLALRLLQLTSTPMTGDPFDASEKLAISRYRDMTSADPLGGAADQVLRDLPAFGLRLKTLLARDRASPRGVPDTAVTTPASRYVRGYEAESGPSHDTAEAAYWYGLAARVGDVRAWTQLGWLLVHSHRNGIADERDAALLWWVASRNGDAYASFNLGAMFDRKDDVLRDRTLALHWYNVALSQGSKNAAAAIQKLAP
jgi:serine/threonine protein kinase